MNLKITRALVKKLLDLANGESIPAAQFKGPLFDSLLKEGFICSKSNKSITRYYVTDKATFRSVLGDYNDGLKDLEGTLAILQKESISRSEQVQIAGNSKIRQVRSCKGFLINSYESVACSLNGCPFTIAPPDGSYVFVADYETFEIPSNAIVVGVENMENFRQIQKQKYLFENLNSPVIFAARYPQSKDLITWLQRIPNNYVHFGDLDLAGVFIYQNEFYAKLQDRASFFIPSDVETRIQNGSTERYDNQLERFEKMEIIDTRIAPVVKLIKHYHKGYDQEGFIE
ncbi:hypothetical protein [uncultured Fibrobacter sp.]|uniref:hypothetical protein n=1 Tax=uncultured Fibrobacter sp. TaxID=261512 RepID=UPI0025FC39D8|nr:hypothetical protein [uncultured Fibrobacter sp.]